MAEFFAFLIVLLLAVRPLGGLIFRLLESPRRGRLESVVYRLCGVNPEVAMPWKQYAIALGLFNFVGLLLCYALQRGQAALPGNPLHLAAVDPYLAFNTATSFVSNTNWQSYGGESTMTLATQTLALTTQNFVSAATGIAAMMALARGLRRTNHTPGEGTGLGNFWVDLTRTTLYVLLPLSFLLALFLVVQGVPQTFHQPAASVNLEGKVTQVVPVGPVASQEAIKQLGTNGGGFYNANSAHPFENPTPLSNFVECLSILLLPAALCYTFGLAVGDKRQGWAILGAMLVLFVPLTLVCVHAEAGNWEGKELRFGPEASALWAAATTAASNGSVNSMHDSFTALGGLIPMVFMPFGEVVFGGVGCGVYGIILHVIVAVFVAGLMVGRTPEYLGKKIQAYEIKMCSLGILVMPALVLVMAGVAVLLPSAVAAVANSGVHGLSEILYACSSMGNNNGSAFAGLSANIPFYNLVGGVVMLFSRFWIALPVLAIAGSLSRKKRAPESAGTLPTHTPLFVVWLTVVIVVVGALSFLPALALGPICEHFAKESNMKPVYKDALQQAFVKLKPRTMAGNPVMFVVEVGSALTTVLWLRDLVTHRTPLFTGQITLWLWFTVIFANFATALAEGRGKAQADALRKSRQDVPAQRQGADGSWMSVPSSELRKGDLVRVEAGQVIPSDGEIVEGVASVDESAITGESAPVIRESGGDRSAVTGGTTVLSDWLILRVQTNPGQGFLDRIISMVEGAKRQKTPNELALNILLAGFTILFLLVCCSLYPFSMWGGATPVTVPVLVALLVCLIPTTIGGLLAAIGIAGMDRLIQRNVMALSGRAVEAAGDVDVLLLDKTGTITYGNRQAAEFTAEGIPAAELARLATLASLADETPEGRSIVALAQGRYGVQVEAPAGATFIPFTAQTRMSGIDFDGQQIREGAADSVAASVGTVPARLSAAVDEISRQGGTPLLISHNGKAVGVVYLKDVVKPGIKERFAQLRTMGIKTIMVTGDNPMTAAAIAAEAGVDDFLAQATPEAKLELIRSYQAGGRLVAMTGDGTNDAPALAQADVAVAMNTGTQAAREAANLIDLDSNPTKLIEIVEIGKQLLITRGALSTFSLSNDVAKYFAIIPAAFAVSHPELAGLNLMHLATPQSAILSAVIFNALIIVALIPLSLRGVRYRPVGAAQLLRDHLLIYGVGGLVCPFVGIKLIDVLVAGLRLA